MEDVFQDNGYAMCINDSEKYGQRNNLAGMNHSVRECDCDSFALKCTRTKPTCSRST